MAGYRLNLATLVLALLAVALTAIEAADYVIQQPNAINRNWFGWLVGTAPPLWLLVAAWLARWESSPARFTILLAVVFTLAIQAVSLWISLYVGVGNPKGISFTGQFWPFYVTSQRAPALLAITAFVPAAAGWWQRRQDRLADGAGEEAT